MTTEKKTGPEQITDHIYRVSGADLTDPRDRLFPSRHCQLVPMGR